MVYIWQIKKDGKKKKKPRKMYHEMHSNHLDCTAGNFQGEKSDSAVAWHPEKSLHIYTTALKLGKIGM